MERSDISEYLAIAYALHCANCSSEGREPIEKEQFFDIYMKNIPDFRRFTGAADPTTG